MGWYSILPAHLSDLETWIARIFLLLGMITIGPWALLLVYDISYYLWRTAAYHIPLIGGKAQGKRRPRAPSLAERPNGEKRGFNVTGVQHDDNGVVKRNDAHTVQESRG